MDNDPTSNWLNQSTTQPEIVEAQYEITHYLEEIGALFLEDTDTSELDATWMVAISICNLYHFIRRNPSQILPLKTAYFELRREKDTKKLERMFQMQPSNLNQRSEIKHHEK
ncbi:hypothetical protein [Brunnivagina elsteri]|uniref:Uncharacterized protein n=1 Tax=Brunnivagina elsteri CCALA 953 TaxID=987040 RepID=A0A2A2TLF0_9CYAN|nr:hypothetical protein [Calothrix elsteri]PAX58376.1 hypothetical protein CK510_07855 [Calothrix elsteri CCALA 953]